MPISDEESETMQEPPQIPNMSKAELRKTHKPIMEKRRRARINNCLNEIKNLILEAMNKDPARHTKLEKADILEMAVKHLQSVQRQQLAIAMATDPSAIRKFKSGFNDCASEIDRFITKSETTPDSAIRNRVSNHLQKCISGLEQAAHFSVPSVPFMPGSTLFTSNPNGSELGGPGDQNNNPKIQLPQGIQLIPSRLPTGELALLVPNSSSLSSYFPSHNPIPQRASAFATVTTHQNDPPKILSPPLSPIEPSRESPKGFRPLQPPTIAKPKPSYPGDDHQVPQISSTVSSSIMEVKTMKFPIHKAIEKDSRKLVEHASVIKKISEPLCVITNQGERFKQAQQKEDSSLLEENQLFSSRGIKRGYSEMLHSQPSVSGEGFARPTKIIKTVHSGEHSSSVGAGNFSGIPLLAIAEHVPEEPSRIENLREVPRGDNNPHGDMWRPW